MKTEKYILIIFTFLSVLSCSKKDDDGGSSTPSATSLVFPANGTECNTGIEVDAATSTVTFDWDTSDNTDLYEVVIEELNTNEVIRETTLATQIDVTINKGTAYSWYVISKANGSSETANSTTWQFFNAGDGIESHTPFPADVVSPVMGHSFDASTTQIDIQWAANDVDGDIASYEVYFGTANPPTTSMGETTSNTQAVTVATGNTYYWQIKTTDEVGNTSTSDVFWFSVE